MKTESIVEKYYPSITNDELAQLLYESCEDMPDTIDDAYKEGVYDTLKLIKQVAQIVL